jgi:hypothetical protein
LLTCGFADFEAETANARVAITRCQHREKRQGRVFEFFQVVNKAIGSATARLRRSPAFQLSDLLNVAVREIFDINVIKATFMGIIKAGELSKYYDKNHVFL